MSKCKETSGFLFPRPCAEAATGSCTSCGRPICGRHTRGGGPRGSQGMPPRCITCVRAELRSHTHRGSYTHLRDDPYFFWYFDERQWYGEGFTAEDYALFSSGDPSSGGEGALEAAFQQEWEGGGDWGGS